MLSRAESLPASAAPTELFPQDKIDPILEGEPNVFLKGCTLRCKWCSNPESIHLFLGRVYEMQDFEPPTEEKLAALRAIIDEAL